ncbi:MAG: hypothetical protein EZS28_013450 [Streblomastix strix]|uniref:Uncharacterized protein n=1 Tax=Streblomastix strix TaxID=222440 RepID=A0A5J4W8R8_9EUKA|nr:MAG: hypothetical protein EZS28_013450 [Streblomastix strix]
MVSYSIDEYGNVLKKGELQDDKNQNEIDLAKKQNQHAHQRSFLHLKGVALAMIANESSEKVEVRKLENRNPNNVIDEFGQEEHDDQSFVQFEEEQEKEIHIFDKIDKQGEKEKRKKLNKDQNKPTELISKEEKGNQQKEQSEIKEKLKEDQNKERIDQNEIDRNGYIALLNEELENDEKQFVNENKDIKGKNGSDTMAKGGAVTDKIGDQLQSLYNYFNNPNEIVDRHPEQFRAGIYKK